MSRDVPTPLPEDLLAHAAWLRRLAASLVRGAGDADDLVQETWLSALRHPPAGGRPVRPWLAQVLRNAWRMRLRTDGRRAQREADVQDGDRPEAVPSADTLLERMQAQKLLAELVVELAEPFRSAMVLRYYEGLTAAQIAAMQGIPAATVRFRLMVGLNKLRKALDERHGGDRARWSLMLLPFAGAQQSTWLLWLKGAWIVSRALKMGALIAALMALAAAAILWSRKRPDVPPAPLAATAATVAGPSPIAPAGSAKPAPAAPREAAPIRLISASVERDETAKSGGFSGRVINWATAKGVANAEVSFSSAGASTAVRTGADGQFHFEPPQPGRYALMMVTKEDFLPFAPEWGHSPIELLASPGMRIRDITVYLSPAIDYTGVVVSPDKKPVPGAVVTLLGAGQGEQALQPISDRFVADARGEFIFHAPDTAILEARHPDYGPGRARLGTATLSHRLEIPLAPKDMARPALGTERIAGRVVDAKGLPIDGALVTARAEEGDPAAPSGVVAPAQATSDEEGRFVLERLDPLAYAVVATHAGYAPAKVIGVRAGTVDLVLSLHEGGVLAGRVVGEKSGQVIPAFTVTVVKRQGPLRAETVTTRSVIDAEGRFEIGELAPGDYGVLATAVGHAPSREVAAVVAPPPASGQRVELRLPEGGKLVGKIISGPGGPPLEYARVSVESTLGDGSSAVPVTASTVTDSKGEFELGGLAPGIRSVLAGAYAHHARILSGLKIDSGATIGPITIDLKPTKDGEQPGIEFAGIGVTFKAGDDTLLIEKVIEGGGAAEAGLVRGDAILSVDGILVTQLGFDGSVQRIRGPEGTIVRLSARKAADGTVVELLVQRRRIQN